MATHENKTKVKSFWLPINLWNLNELFSTESISPISFYSERNFGNPVNRNHEVIEDTNNLIFFDDAVQNDVLLEISNTLFDEKYLTKIKSGKNSSLNSFEYSKTVYLKKDHFKLHFTSKDKLNEFLNNTFMLLEVKTTNKYKSSLCLLENKPKKTAFYQTQLISNKQGIQPYFDKAYNQIKGLIYGYLIGSIGTLEEKEQTLVSDLSKLKNTIGSIHTDIVLSDQYSGFWLINVRKQIKDCQKSFFGIFAHQSDTLETLLLRLEEIDNLNQMRCSEFSKQKTSSYKINFEKSQEALEIAKQKLYELEYRTEIIFLREEFERIKKEEKLNGELNGKSREYFKKGTIEYDRKQELKQLISSFEANEEYQNLKRDINYQEELLRDYQFGFTQYDSSITEQFSRISEQLHEITKKTTTYFLSKNNKSSDFPDISFEISISQLAEYYLNGFSEYSEFSLSIPTVFSDKLSEPELQLIKIAINSLLTKPQGRLGDFSEQNILNIIKDIGEHLNENDFKQTFRDYYLYRIGKKDSFNFPENMVLANVIVFLMKLNGHEQINKMLVTKNIHQKQIAFLLYGAYLGFANMPKTFTNIVFESGNEELFDHIDNYLFKTYLTPTQ